MLHASPLRARINYYGAERRAKGRLRKSRVLMTFGRPAGGTDGRRTLKNRQKFLNEIIPPALLGGRVSEIFVSLVSARADPPLRSALLRLDVKKENRCRRLRSLANERDDE